MPTRKTRQRRTSKAPRRRSNTKKKRGIQKLFSHTRRHKKKRTRPAPRGNFRASRFFLLALISAAVFFFARNDFDMEQAWADVQALPIFEWLSQETQPELVFSDAFYEHAAELALLYPEGRDVVYLEFLTIQADDWEEERLFIGGHDALDRTLPIVAHLSEANLGTSDERTAQTHLPTGWHQNQYQIDDVEVWVKNRGHLIAYTLTFNFDEDGLFAEGYSGSENDPANLFTQTAHSNQVVMTHYEAQVRDVLADGCNVVFKAAPIFRDDELMARGIWLQADSVCGDLRFSVFIFNEQPGVNIDHQTGENWLSH